MVFRAFLCGLGMLYTCYTSASLFVRPSCFWTIRNPAVQVLLAVCYRACGEAAAWSGSRRGYAHPLAQDSAVAANSFGGSVGVKIVWGTSELGVCAVKTYQLEEGVYAALKGLLSPFRCLH